MNSKSTILYYTSNREGENFEQRIRDNILKVSNLPIVSVSQKPIDFGKNIVVGDHGVSGFNMFRQVQIGLKEVKTKFVISAEADCLYPPDYFEFVPPRVDVPYRDSNTWVMPQWRAFFWNKKESATHTQVVGTKFYLDTLNKLFHDAPDWSVKENNFPKERHKKEDVFDEIKHWKSKYPVVQIKTKRSMRHYTHSERIDTHELPYWGKGVDFRKKYYGDN
jgi:hypothetical protein